MKTIYKSTDGKEFDTAKECKAYELRNTSFKFIDKPDDTILKDLIKKYLNYIQSDEYYEDNEWETWFFETVIETYVKDFWDTFNKLT